jgi:hypothetical protein
MRKFISKSISKFGYKITKDRTSELLPPEFLRDYAAISPFSMVDHGGGYAVWEAVNYVVDRQIEGAFVECGVWRGGMSMLMARRLAALADAPRQQYLYDTFEGMSEPGDIDRDKHGAAAAERLAASSREDESDSVWAFASQGAVTRNFIQCGIPLDNVKMIKGKVEDTIPGTIPEKIAILRLDTDWYESTKHELEHLYPRLMQGGVLLIDDYGFWQGCRKAVDEFFGGKVPRPYMTLLANGSITAIKV